MSQGDQNSMSLRNLNLPTLADTPRGGWRDGQPEPTRLQKKAAEDKDDRKAEAKWRAEVWKRDGGCCRWCHREVRKCLELVPTRGECHHVVPRVNRQTRWDPRAALLLCAACHERLTGKVNEKCVIVATHVFKVNGIEYPDASKRVRFKRVV